MSLFTFFHWPLSWFSFKMTILTISTILIQNYKKNQIIQTDMMWFMLLKSLGIKWMAFAIVIRAAPTRWPSIDETITTMFSNIWVNVGQSKNVLQPLICTFQNLKKQIVNTNISISNFSNCFFTNFQRYGMLV